MKEMLSGICFLLSKRNINVQEMRRTVILLFMLVGVNLAFAQTKLSGTYKNKTLKEVFSEIEKHSSYHFFISDNYINTDKVVNISFKNKTITEVLTELFSGTNIKFEIKDNNLIVLNTELQGRTRKRKITGIVSNSSGEVIPGVTVIVEGKMKGSITDINGFYSLEFEDDSKFLIFSFIGMEKKIIEVGDQLRIDVVLVDSSFDIDEVIAVGYGKMKKKSITGSISDIASGDIEMVHSSTLSSTLAGKIAGVSYRMADGRPGSSASIQIRNMGAPLYVIDGFQKDVGQFNNISPNDIESISFLKDASAAIYGVRAANGVIVVTTKRGNRDSSNEINVNSYTGWQNWSRFPETVNAYEWMLGKADAEMNSYGSTSITPDELQKWNEGNKNGYKSFDWYDFIIAKNSPQTSVNVSTSGGSGNINYYLSLTQLNQNSVLGDEFSFGRTNIQSNLDSQIGERIKLGIQINGRVETRDNPGIPGSDDYWAPVYALLRNRPTERPYANDNPDYINDIGHNSENWAILNKKSSGYWTENWRVVQLNLDGEYDLPIEGLKASARYSYYLADRVMDGHEYTYDAYTYFPNNPEGEQYQVTFTMQNPWRERGTRKVIENASQFQLDYAKKIGMHDLKVTFVNERIERKDKSEWVHAIPETNAFSLIQFSDMDTYDDSDYEEARIGYIGRINYNYNNKYYLEFAGRKDASWKFSPDDRWGLFYSASAGWRITEEKFVKTLLGNSLVDLKLRASYGKLGDDNISNLGAFDYLEGYNYGTSTVIIDGTVVTGARDKGVPVTNISWYTSKITDIGIDYSILNGKISGEIDYFYRKRDGLKGSKDDVIVPDEIGYDLPDENINTDAISGYDFSIVYGGKIGELSFSVGGSFSYAREKYLQSYKPKFSNSYDYFTHSSEGRYTGVFWGYEAIGQFQSVDQINSYPVNIDGEGNQTLLPGDIIYKDMNKDGLIDYRDERPIGYSTGNNPVINYGFNIEANYKRIDFKANLSGGAMYSYNQSGEMRTPYLNGGNLLKIFYEDRWHREDPFDVNSAWIHGKYPALRYNTDWHSNYNKNSTFWLTNVRYLRLRTLEIGYSLPTEIISKVGVEKFRFYVNTYNLFSFDNLKEIGVDPEIQNQNGLQYPQSKFINLGVNVSF